LSGLVVVAAGSVEFGSGSGMAVAVGPLKP
jgi:hypothetical protein